MCMTITLVMVTLFITRLKYSAWVRTKIQLFILDLICKIVASEHPYFLTFKKILFTHYFCDVFIAL